MAESLRTLLAVAAIMMLASCVYAQETKAPDTGDLLQNAEQTLDSAKQTVDELAKQVDQDQRAQQAKAGVLKPIYQLAEFMSFPAFHWLAFGAMVAGVVSFALQLTLGKLVVLAKLGFSPSEILSDALGLMISLVGLVLTTQAATENSTFTTSAASVLSATAVGAVLGLMFYWWGQKQELQAVSGRSEWGHLNAVREEV